MEINMCLSGTESIHRRQIHLAIGNTPVLTKYLQASPRVAPAGVRPTLATAMARSTLRTRALLRPVPQCV